MSLEDSILDPLVQATNSMIANNEISIAVATRLMAHLSAGISEAKLNLMAEVQEKITTWDEMYGEKDKTLYTLGLRHALDIISGEVATTKNGFNDKPYKDGQEYKLDEIM